MRLLVLTAFILLLASAAHAREDAGQLGVGDAYAVELLSQLRSAYRGIERERAEGNELALRIQFDLAISSLAALDQLFGFDWARRRQAAMLHEADCPDIHIGYSDDRRLQLRIEPLELKNPAFEGQLVLLCTLESLQDTDVHTEDRGQLQLKLSDGSTRTAELLAPEHPLWEHLGSQADAFLSPDYLPSGHNVVFKQLYSAPAPGRNSISAVSLDWDQRHFGLEWMENEVSD
ncbi:hypothetical protein KDL29_13110 [bacterium]|nr:hypothetical protein [bacterium]